MAPALARITTEEYRERRPEEDEPPVDAGEDPRGQASARATISRSTVMALPVTKRVLCISAAASGVSPMVEPDSHSPLRAR